MVELPGDNWFWNKTPDISWTLLCLTDEPRNIVINVSRTDDAIVLTCSADANPAPMYHWTDSTSNFTSNDAVIALNVTCLNASVTTLTCAAVCEHNVSITQNVIVKWTYSRCGPEGKISLNNTAVTDMTVAIIEIR